MEQVYFDMFPETSRCIDDWEKVFAVVFSSKELEKQRNVLAALWRINKGGQSAVFLESMLRNIDADILVVENTPVSNPRQRSVTNVAVCGNKTLCCKNVKAVCGYRIGDEGFSPTVLRNDVSELYSIKNDPRFWVYCYFVCKSVVRNNKNEILYIEKLQIKKEFRNYIEYLILKIKPVHTVAVMFIEWI
nr:MAG TPA: protein of unknown function (DUF2313) [Caudoviricetes sp.]